MAEARPIPERTCVACRTRRDKASLLRIVRRPDGTVVLDRAGDLEGRGAYLCRDLACHRVAVKRSVIGRALRTAIPDELRTRLEHGDITLDVATGYGAPQTMTGGNHGA